MAKYCDSSAVCDHQHSGIINMLADDHFLDEESRSTHPLLGAVDEPPTFCMRCRSLSNSSSVIQYESDVRAASGDWTASNGYGPLNNTYYPSVGHQHTAINYSDGADMPLLINGDGCRTRHDEELDHCHSALPLTHSSSAWKQLLAATVMCLIFMVSEIVGGYMAGSLAVMTDAAHLLSDLVGFVISLLAIWMGRRPATRSLSFGYHRAEVLGALLSVVLIWIVTGVFIYIAILRLIHGNFTIDADIMMIVAAVGVVINIVMGLVLHGMCAGHHHTHTHRNINVRAAVIHVLGDLIQSVGVFVSSIVIKFYPGAKVADPICTFLFSLLVLLTTLTVLRDATHMLMEGFPRHLDYAVLSAQLHSVDGVRSVHGLHAWSLTAGNCHLAVHLAIAQLTCTWL
ncbi:proton-coupled zinc antiporter SLC30A2 isoform X2 [Anabrus simplex]|uniref:proton-coupled zinc antiporter SLC30A2 isoform X2 n=1 Tax=Anabrus simplex TaxID=316456 RepID=UPI0034DDB913